LQRRVVASTSRHSTCQRQDRDRPAFSSRKDKEEEEEGYVVQRRIDRNAAADCRPHCKEEQGHQKKKKASISVDLREHPVWVDQTDGKKHRVVAIAHEQK
jgi:hypothetical protein